MYYQIIFSNKTKVIFLSVQFLCKLIFSGHSLNPDQSGNLLR